MLEKLEQALIHFHYDKCVAQPCDWDDQAANIRGMGPLGERLAVVVSEMRRVAQELEDDRWLDQVDKRYLRIHLILEEVGECLKAMLAGDVVETFDGILDSIYVLAGTAVQFRMPLSKGMAEVHRSNMTKPPRQGERLRDKTGYEPPLLRELLEKR